MKIFNKLVNILFDEQEEEIPVITKNSAESKPSVPDNGDEVIVTKIERDTNTSDDDMFDMPKFKEETKDTEEKESTFSFPFIDDDEFASFDDKRSLKKKEKEEKKESNRYDFLSSTDYKKSDSYTASRNNIYSSSDDKKPFTLSPIISPVYGILNENYKKEDIVARDSSQNRTTSGKIDLDSVRKKAYGTLEDEIEVTLGGKKEEDDILEEVPTHDEMTIDTLSDDGISIDDLLVDSEKTEEEVFDIGTEEIDEEEIELDDNQDENIDSTSETKEKEEDLFDLIDSIYAGKDEE